MTPQSNNPNRRQFMRRVGAVTLGAGAAYYGGTEYAGSPVQNGQAIAPLVVAGAVGASVAAGWLLRETEVIGSNPPAEGLTRDALISDYHSTARARQSTNGTKIFDTAEILDGAEHVAYADGKIAAIDALNDQKQESEVIRAGKDAVDKYFSKTVITNLLRTWNEAVNELHGMIETGRSHPEISPESYLVVHNGLAGGSRPPTAGWSTDSSTQYELPDGSTIEVKSVHATNNWHDYNTGSETGDVVFDPTRNDEYGNDRFYTDSYVGVTNGADSFSSGDSWGDFLSGGEVEYLHYNDWSEILNQCELLHENVTTGLDQWVSGVYGEVQAGSLDTAELLTPREQAELTSENEGFPQAIADLQALNVSVDLEREAEVYLPDLDATIYGQLGYTGDTQLEVGTVDPNATSADGNEVYPGSFYFTYDISRGEGTWGDYNSGIDGGLLTFTAEPYAETVYTVQTAGETVEVTSSDFSDNGDGTWTADLSGQLDNSITSAEEIKFYSETGETQYETIQLDSTFEIRGFTDSDGNEYNKSNFERSEPQTDTNYISQEEWEEQQKRNEELIEKYEDSQSNGGATTGSSSFSTEQIIAGVVGTGVAAYLFGK